MPTDDWREVEVPGEGQLEFWKLEHYQLTDTMTHARFRITWYDGIDRGPFSLAELKNVDEFDQEMRSALEMGPTDGHFGGRKDNLNDTLRKVWNNIQRGGALKEKRESQS